MSEHTKTFDEIKQEIRTVVGTVGDFYSNTTKMGVMVGNCTLYESGDVLEDGNKISFNENKYKLVFYGEKNCAAAKRNLEKGMLVEASGAYREREYEKDGVSKISYEIIVKGLDIKKTGDDDENE